jgi:nanoRNase/pAp phosphatase (c-di-AMP/oligoRNAs hydrolase)
MHIIWGLKQLKTVFAIGKSILDRRCKTKIGELMLEYSGGGHDAAGTCQVDNASADQVQRQLIERIVNMSGADAATELTIPHCLEA